MTRRRRQVTAIAAAVAVVAVVTGAWWVHPALTVGIGHTARTLCSGVFVSGRDPAAVLADLRVDDMAILRYIDARVEPDGASADILGLVPRHAVHRPGLGCTLVLDGLEPPHATVPEGRGADGLPAGPAPPGLEAIVARAFEEPDPARPRRTRAVVVVQRGHVVAERYAPGMAADTPLAGWSMTKSVMNALAGILVGDGRLTLHEPAPIAEWRGDPRAAITVDHLLRMSSGLSFDEGMSGTRSDVIRMLFGTGDVSRFAIGKPLVSPPGGDWQYASGSTNILSAIIRRTIGDDRAYLTLPRHALFDRIGMDTAVMETDGAGTFIGSSYMYASARDWARFGMLYLQDGVWNGQRILPEGWVAYTSAPAPADPSGRYGAHFWVQIPGDYDGGAPSLPAPALHAAGHEAQFITIVPSYDAVIVRLGRTRYPDAWDHPAFVREVMAALGRR